MAPLRHQRHQMRDPRGMQMQGLWWSRHCAENIPQLQPRILVWETSRDRVLHLGDSLLPSSEDIICVRAQLAELYSEEVKTAVALAQTESRDLSKAEHRA
eukprot:2575914-Amphidinium_carterae.1